MTNSTEIQFPIKPKPVFIQTTNVRNFSVMMTNLSASRGEGRLAAVHSRAGRGKTVTTQHWAAANNAVYLRMQTVWRTSELYFLQGLCLETGVEGAPPHRKAPAFAAVVDRLLAEPRTVFLDEIEKLPAFMLDVVRDLSDLSAAPFVLIGEEELCPAMKRNRRVWSRTYQQLEFKPIEIKDVIIYANELAGIKIAPDAAQVFHRASDGDFRIVRRDILNLLGVLNARQSLAVDPETAQIAVNQGLRN